MLSLVLLMLLCFLLYLIFNQPASTSHIPGPSGLALIGNIFDVLGKNPSQFYKTLSDKYGPMVSVQMGLRRVVIISDASLVREILGKSGNAFDSRPKGTLLDFIIGGKGIVMTTGPATQEARALLHNSLKKFGDGKEAIETYIDLEVQEFLHILKKNVGNPYNPRKDLNISVLNVIWQMISGVRFQMGDPVVGWFVETIELSLVVVESCGFLNFIFILQALTALFNPKGFLLLMGLLRRNRYFNQTIAKHRQELNEENTGQDFVYDFLENQKKKSVGNDVQFMHSDTQLKWIMSDVFVAGMETMTGTLINALINLAIHPTIQDKMHEEIEAVIGLDRMPLLSDRKEMPFTRAFIDEVLRLYSAVPIVFRSTSEDTYLRNSFIPKDTWIFINIRAIHMDEKVWSDPEIFRPQRFQGNDDRYVPSQNHIPFSVGPKSCIGKHLAVSEFFLFLTNILQNYKVSSANDDKSQPVTNKSGLTLIPPDYSFCFTSKRKQNMAN